MIGKILPNRNFSNKESKFRRAPREIGGGGISRRNDFVPPTYDGSKAVSSKMYDQRNRRSSSRNVNSVLNDW